MMDKRIDDIRYQHHVKYRGEINHWIFWITWCLILIFVLSAGLRRAALWWRHRRNVHVEYQALHEAPTKKVYTRVTASLRAMSILPLPYLPQFVSNGVTFGRFIVLAVIFLVVGSLTITVGGPFFSSQFFDDIAFRTAWVAITQIPLVYLLSTKHGPVNLLLRLSYERVNWMHKWVGRILFVSVTVHAVIMKSSISMQDIIESYDEGMTVVRKGLAAYGMLVWIVLTSILPLRRWSYRAFYLSHWISTIIFLLIAIQHVPCYARTSIYLAMTFVALDKGLWIYYFCRNNIFFNPIQSRYARYSRVSGGAQLFIGYSVEMTARPSAVAMLPRKTKDVSTAITISKIPFSWKPGQHIRLYIPALGAFEMHPFTPANCSASPPPPLPPRGDLEQSGRRSRPSISPPVPTSEMLLILRAHTGFTRRLADYYEEWLTYPCPNASEAPSTLTAYVDGPYGNAPCWEEYENLVLIASSTGVSFTLSIMDYLEQLCFLNKRQWQTKTVTFIWAVRHIDPALEEMVRGLLTRYGSTLRDSGVQLEIEFFITCPHSDDGLDTAQYDPFAHLRVHQQARLLNKPALRIRNPKDIYEEWDREAAMEAGELTGELKEAEPIVYSSSNWSTFEGDESSEISTLVEDFSEDEQEQGQEQDPFSDTFVTSEEYTESHGLLPSQQYVPARSSSFIRDQHQDCQCGLIQHQKRKLNLGPPPKDSIKREYATRPDLSFILQQAMPRTSMNKTMVAVCANESMTTEARKTVAKLNIDFSLGRQTTEVEIFTEGFN